MVVTALDLLATKYMLHYYPEHKGVYHCNFIYEFPKRKKKNQTKKTHKKNQPPKEEGEIETHISILDQKDIIFKTNGSVPVVKSIQKLNQVHARAQVSAQNHLASIPLCFPPEEEDCIPDYQLLIQPHF